MSTPMRASRVILGASVAVAVAVVTLGLVATASTPPNDNMYAQAQFLIGLSAVSVGTFVAAKRPDHPMGWLLLVAGGAQWITFATPPVMVWLMQHAPGQEQLARWVLHVGISGWIVCRGVFIALVPQAMPDGFARTRAARALLMTSVAAIALAAIGHSHVNTVEYMQGQAPTGTARLAENLLPWIHR